MPEELVFCDNCSMRFVPRYSEQQFCCLGCEHEFYDCIEYGDVDYYEFDWEEEE